MANRYKLIEPKNGHGVRKVYFDENGTYISSHYLTLQELENELQQAISKTLKRVENIILDEPDAYISIKNTKILIDKASIITKIQELQNE